MNRFTKYFLFGLMVLLTYQSCKGPGGSVANQAASRGRSQVRKWLRYEVGQAKSFSYGSSQIRPGVTVIGYEPSWLIYDSLYQNYHFEYLTDLVMGEYDINPQSGFARYDSARIAYQVEEIVEYAAFGNSGINLLTAVTYYGDYGTGNQPGKFLSEAAKKNLIKSLDVTLDEISGRMGNTSRERVGVLLDFQNIPSSQWREYPKFINRLKQALNKPEQEKSALIYVVAPLYPVQEDWHRDSTVLKRVVRMADKVVLRAHSFGAVPQKLGPMIPVRQDTANNWYHDLEHALSEYTDTLGLENEKLVVEFPYYGLNWYDSTDLSNKYPMMASGQMMLMAADTPLVYTDSAGAYFIMDDSVYTLEDTTTLDWKYKFINETGIGGIGIYGVGYAYGFNPVWEEKLWEIIGNTFGEQPPRLFFPGISFFLSFFGIGIAFAVVRSWEVRFALRRKRMRFWFYVLMMALLILAIVLCLYPIEVVSMKWKIIAICLLILVPLGRKVAMLLFKMGR